MRAEGDLPELLAAIARTISESLGYRTVVVNLYRPAWDNFSVTTVHGNDAARSILLGQVRTWDEWRPLLQPEFERRGAFVVPAGAYDWDAMLGDRSYVPDSTPGRGENGWHPEDALFLPMRHSDGHLLGILSVDEPVSGRRPTDEELDVLVALAEHAALAVQSAQEGRQAARHRLALERLLGVSSRLIAEPATDDILRAVCLGVRDALGFQNVLAALRDPELGPPRPARGRRLGSRGRRPPAPRVPARHRRLDRPGVRGRRLLPPPERRGRAAHRGRPASVRVRAERPRPLGVGPPLAARAAARQCGRGDRRALGG